MTRIGRNKIKIIQNQYKYRSKMYWKYIHNIKSHHITRQFNNHKIISKMKGIICLLIVAVALIGTSMAQSCVDKNDYTVRCVSTNGEAPLFDALFDVSAGAGLFNLALTFAKANSCTCEDVALPGVQPWLTCPNEPLSTVVLGAYKLVAPTILRQCHCICAQYA